MKKRGQRKAPTPFEYVIRQAGRFLPKPESKALIHVEKTSDILGGCHPLFTVL